MAPKRDTAPRVAQGRGRHQHPGTLSPEVAALQVLTATLKLSSTCSSTCSCGSLKNITAPLIAAEQESPGSCCGSSSLLNVIHVLSSLAAVLITGQHSIEAQYEGIELLERLVSKTVRELYPLSPFPADAVKLTKQEVQSTKFLLGAQMGITFIQAGLVPALQAQATEWASHCATVTRHLRMFKTVQALADSTQEQHYLQKAEEAATNLRTYCAGLKEQAHFLQSLYLWGCSTLLAQPMLHRAGAAILFAPLAQLAATHLQLMRLLQQCIDSGMQLPAPFVTDPWEWEVVNTSTQACMWSMMSALAAALPDACGCLKGCKPDHAQAAMAQQLQQLMSSPDLIVPLTLAMLCGGQALNLAVDADARLQEHAPASAAGGPSGLSECVSAVNSSTSGIGSSSSSNSSSVGGSLDPWELAEGVLLVRAEQLQSHTAAKHQLTAVLQYSQRACQQWWQQMHCPGDLAAAMQSYVDVGLGSLRRADVVRMSQFNSALQLLLHFLQQPRLLAAVKPHAASALQVLLSAAAAVMPTALFDAESAMPLVQKCLDAAASLVKLLPMPSAADNGAGQQQQQQLGGAGCSHQQQQQGLSAHSQQPSGAAGPSRQQLLGSLLHLLQQLLLFIAQPPPDDDDCDSYSSGESSSSSSSSSGGGGNKGEAAGAVDPLSSEGKLRDAPLLAMARALPLLQQLLDPLLDPQQLAACLQQQQQQGQQQHGQQQQQQQQQQQGQELLEQVAWAVQVTEAAVRVLAAAGTKPARQAWFAKLAEDQAKPGDSSVPTHALTNSSNLQLLQSRLRDFAAGVGPLMRMLCCKLTMLVQLPGAWEGLRSSMQGQQLLQAALSLLLVYKEGSAGKPAFFHVPLMQLVSRDIRAFLAATAEGNCPAASSQQQQQQQQQQLLPHPQLVVCVLALAAQHYMRPHRQLLWLTTERGAHSDGVSQMLKVSRFWAGYFAPLAAAATGAGTAAAADGAAAAAAEFGTAAATAADACGRSAGVGAAAAVEDFSVYSSALQELLQALSDLSTAASSHGPHKQQQDEQQQQLPPAWDLLPHGNALSVLLPALFRAADALDAVVAAAAPNLQQWQQSAADAEAQLVSLSARSQKLRESLAATHQLVGRTPQRRRELKALSNQQESELSECSKRIKELEQMLPLPLPLLTGLAKPLHVIGALLSSLPSRYHCNNFDCTSLSTVSEAFALVRGRSCVCGGCVAGSTAIGAAAREVPAARYCSADCQRQHFHIHKWVCGAQQHINSSAAAGSSPHTAGSSGSSGSSGAGPSSSSSSGSSSGASGSSNVELEATVSSVLRLAAARAESKVSQFQQQLPAGPVHAGGAASGMQELQSPPAAAAAAGGHPAWFEQAASCVISVLQDAGPTGLSYQQIVTSVLQEMASLGHTDVGELSRAVKAIVKSGLADGDFLEAMEGNIRHM